MKTKKYIVSNPLVANATGKIEKTVGKQGTAADLQSLSKKLLFIKRKKGDATSLPDFKVEKCTYAILPYYLDLGYGSSAGYEEFGRDVIKKWFDKNKKFQWYMIIPAIGFTYMTLIRPLQHITNAITNKPYSLFDVKERCVFEYGATAEAKKAWRKFSGEYFNNGNNTLLHNLFERINLYFQVDFKKKIKELHLQQEAAKLKKKEAELTKDAAALEEATKEWTVTLQAQEDYMKYLSDKLLDEQITGVLRENAEQLPLMKDCVRTFIENPTDVFRYQWIYYKNRLLQEAGIAKQMKSGYGASGADGIINNMVNTLRNADENIYNNALKNYIPRNNYNQILYKNTTEASKWLKQMQALPIQLDISEYYTENIATSDVNENGDWNKNRGKNSNVGLVAIAILGAIFLLKKKKAK